MTAIPTRRRFNHEATALRAVSKQEVGTVRTVSSAYGTESTQEEQTGPRRFAPGQEPAHVRVAIGKTISLGAGTYEFLRIDVSVTLPCLPEEIDESYEQAAQFVTDKLVQEENQWLGAPLPARTASRRG